MTTCSLNGIRLAEIASASWRSRSGLEPTIGKVFVEKHLLDSAIKRTENVTLKIGERVIGALRVIATGSGTGAGDLEPGFSTIYLADRRSLLGMTSQSVAFNQRRRTGESTIGSTDVPVQVAATIPAESYLPTTLDAGEPYTLRRALQEVIEESGYDRFVIPQSFPDFDAFGERGLRMDGTTKEIIDALLSFAPQWEVGQADSGETYLYDTTDHKAELDAVKELGPALKGGGSIDGFDQRWSRFSGVDVYLFCEAEQRFDYDIDNDLIYAFQSSASVFLAGDTEPAPAVLESWIVNPVAGLEFLGQNLARGSVLNVYALLQALSDAHSSGALPLPSAAAGTYGPLREDLIRKFYLQDWMSSNIYEYEGGPYQTIMRDLLNSYHTQFRLPKEWADRVAMLMASRVEIIDPATLTRRESPCFFDYMTFPNQRMLNQKTTADYPYAALVQENSVGAETENCKVAPAQISVRDQQAKTLTVQPRRSPNGQVAEYIPAVLEELPDVLNASDIWGYISRGGTVKRDWQFATIVTCTPQVRPRGKSHLFKVEVTPDQVAETMGIPRKRLGDCLGPRLEIIISPSPATMARFVWKDELAEDLRRPFFDSRATFPEGALQNKRQVESLAKAWAAAAFVPLLDRLDGAQTGVADRAAPLLVGTVKGVETTAAPGSAITTSLQFGATIKAPNANQFLPADIRDQLNQRIVQP